MEHNASLKMDVATPCTKDWKEMAGDGRVRFCLHCSKNVYNIAGFSTEEIRELIRQHEGKLCVRIYQREDGTVVTQNCPAAQSSTHTRIVIGATVAVLALMSGLGGLFAAQPASINWSILSARVEYQIDELTWKIKEMCGIKRPLPVMMGDFAPPPASSSAPTSSTHP